MDIPFSKRWPDIAALSPIWEEAIQPLIKKWEASQEEQREIVNSVLIQRYDEAVSTFELNKARVIATWRKSVKIAGVIVAGLITLGAFAYYKLSAQQSGTEALIIGAGGNGLWALICWIFHNIKFNDTSWFFKSKRSTLELATPKVLDEVRRIELSPPVDLVEIQDQCRARLATALTQLIVARGKQIRLQADSVIAEIDRVRRSGRQTIEAYRAEWEKAREIIEKLYQQSDDKADKFKVVATTFKQRAMDRTRQLFGDR